MSGEALVALQAANDPPELFVRRGRMVTVIRDECHRHIVVDVSESALRGRLARGAFYYKLNRQQDRIECAPPIDVVRDLLALPPTSWNFPPLAGC